MTIQFNSQRLNWIIRFLIKTKNDNFHVFIIRLKLKAAAASIILILSPTMPL